MYGANASVLDAFREAVTAIKSRIYKRESLIFAKEIKQEDFSEYYLEKEIERELEQYLKEGNESKTGTTLDKLFKDIEKSPNSNKMYGTSVFADYPYIPKDDSNGKS